MIDDTTASMQTADTCGGTPTDVPPTVPLTQEDCAKAGIRAFLTQLYPCQPALAHCDISDQTSSASLDQVGLVTFPGLASTFTTGTGVAQEMNCTQEFTHNATTPTEISYANNANYQIIPFSSDFRYSDAPTRDPLATLNPDSNLVRSVYWPGDFCPNGGYPVNVSGARHFVDRGRQHRLREQQRPSAHRGRREHERRQLRHQRGELGQHDQHLGSRDHPGELDRDHEHPRCAISPG